MLEVNGIEFRKQGDHYIMFINGKSIGTCATVSEGLYDLRKEAEEEEEEKKESKKRDLFK